MLAIFAVIIGGIVTGRLLVGWRLAFVQRLITFIIWALLSRWRCCIICIHSSWALWEISLMR